MALDWDLADLCDTFTHILQGRFTGTQAIVRLRRHWDNRNHMYSTRVPIPNTHPVPFAGHPTAPDKARVLFHYKWRAPQIIFQVLNSRIYFNDKISNIRKAPTATHTLQDISHNLGGEVLDSYREVSEDVIRKIILHQQNNAPSTLYLHGYSRNLRMNWYPSSHKQWILPLHVHRFTRKLKWHFWHPWARKSFLIQNSFQSVVPF